MKRRMTVLEDKEFTMQRQKNTEKRAEEVAKAFEVE